jgi:hypothetical protein
MKETGKIIKWKDKVYLRGLIIEDTKGLMLMIKKKAMVFFIGLMEEYIKVNGKMVNNMEKEFILIKKVSRERGNGKRERQ